MNYRRYRHLEKGFTLVELIAVMIIIGLLAGGATLAITGQVKKARQQAAKTAISEYGNILTTFHLDCGFYPSSLEGLIHKESLGRRCKNYTKGGYVKGKEIKDDPWDNPYNYVTPGVHDPDGYDLWSAGPDDEEGTSDDLTSWPSEEV